MKSLFWSALALALLLPSASRAEDKKLTVTVTAGKDPIKNLPITVPLSVSPKLAKETAADVRFKGTAIAGQLTAPGITTEAKKAEANKVRRDLHFIIPELKAGEAVTLTVDLG